MDSSILLFIVIFIQSFLFLYASNKNYTDCGEKIQCGILKNLGYPFFGESRPAYCGHPSFGLTDCQSSGYPLIKINSFSYRIISLDDKKHMLKLVRDDFFGTRCPDYLHNATIDNSGHFSYASDTLDLVLYYNCVTSVGTLMPLNKFPCYYNKSLNDVFYTLSDVKLNEGVTCNTSVNIRVASSFNTLSPNVTEAVLGGFEVLWDAENSDCDDCTYKGGRCGSDPSSKSFQCYESGSSKGSDQIVVAVSVVGAFVALLGICFGLFVFRKRRERIIAIQSSQSDSKGNTSLSTSKGLTFTTTPTSNFSQSTPSYGTPQLEFSKSSSYFGVQVFTYTELEEATNNFDKSRELGEGGFGTVYYGNLKDGRVVAVKRLYENNYKRIEQFMNELDILTRLRHENLVTLYGCTSRRSRELLLVYEYVPNGTVADHLYGKGSNSSSLSWPTRLKIAIETADALTYLHKSDIIHRDVKTNNILLDSDFCVKVADFGLSRLFPTDVTHVSTAPQGTPGYVDPEYHNCYQLTEKSDVFSFGVVLIELISSKQAVDTNRDRLDINLANMAINRIQNGSLHQLVDPSLGFETDSSVRRMTTLVAELAFRCLQIERDMRPSMTEVLKALRGIRDGKLSTQEEEVVEIVIEDDVALLKGRSTPVSPRSPVTQKLARNSSSVYSSG